MYVTCIAATSNSFACNQAAANNYFVNAASDVVVSFGNENNHNYSLLLMRRLGRVSK
jgi:hypothetical protein